jgi:hypothetical protein
LLALLTCRLIVLPAPAWQELAADQAECLPSPALHGAAVAGLSALLTALVASLGSGATFGSVLRSTLAAIGGCTGATALAVLLVPLLFPWRSAQLGELRLQRYASVSSLPLAAAAGLCGLLPYAMLSCIAIALLGALAYRSGSLGARDFLGLRGPRRTCTAGMTALVSTSPALLAALIAAR